MLHNWDILIPSAYAFFLNREGSGNRDVQETDEN